MSSALTKNAIWVAVSSTIAGVCLWTAIMNHESGSTVSTRAVDGAIAGITKTAASKVRKQDEAGQNFVNTLGAGIAAEDAGAQRYCKFVNKLFRN